MCEACDMYGKDDDYWYFNPENYARRIYKWRKTATETTAAGENPSAEPGDASLIGEMGAMQTATIDMKVSLTKKLPKDEMCEFTFIPK